MSKDAPLPASTPLAAWLDRLAQADGEPGGGAACGVMLGLSAALLRMVAEYTHDDDEAAECAHRLATLRGDALAGAETDGTRSAELGAALRTTDEDPNRDDLVRGAALAAAESSARLGGTGIALVDELRLLARVGNPHLAADLAVAGEALAAGIAGASINLRANLQLARRHRRHSGDADLVVDRLEGEASRLSAARAAASDMATRAASRFDE